MMIAALNGVSKTFRSPNSVVNALDDISLEIYENEFIVLVGPSGSGKTTLLNILADLTQPSEGVVRRRSEINRPGGIGMVFQNATLLPWRTVLQNVLLPAEIFGMSKSEADSEARDLLELVGLVGFEDALPHQLSGGMQQRVSLCRALLSDPPLLLMDEPFGALDAISREAMSVELQRIWMGQKTTVVFVTHSISEALFLSDRVVALTARPGKVAGVIDNDLPRPRTMHTFELPRYTEYSAQLREMIKTGTSE
jgi:NitT/TauT family transport system ATP-binding protein